MDYWMAIVCLLAGGVLLWHASRKLSPADQSKLDAQVAHKTYWRWVWLVVILAYPFLSNLVRALVLCVAVSAMALAALQRSVSLARMGLPGSYLFTRILGGGICFAGAGIVCWDLVHEALAQKG